MPTIDEIPLENFIGKGVKFDFRHFENGHVITASEVAQELNRINHILKPEPAYIPLATVANKMGRIIGENLAGAHHTFNGSLASACLKVMNLEAGRTGLSEQEAMNLGINYKTVFITDMNQTSYYPGQSKINVKLIYNADTKVILGGQIVGRKDAVQRVNVLATAIFAGLTTDQLAMLDLCYAPPFARTWDVLNIAGSVAK